MNISRIPSIFKNVKREPKRFNYSPRHFDPQAEELEKRKAKIREEMGMETGEGSRDIKIDFRSSMGRGRRRGSAPSSSLRMLLILAILLFLAFSVIKWLERYQ